MSTPRRLEKQKKKPLPVSPLNPPLQHLLRQILRPSQRRLLRRRRPLHLHLLLNLHRSPHPQRPLMTSLLLRPSRLP